MNNIFDLRRFFMLFKKHTYEKGKEYLLSILTITVILLVGLGYTAYSTLTGLAEDIQAVIFIITLLLSGIIFTSMVFLDLSDKRKATTYLTLPASHVEKYLVNWLFSYLIFQIIFTAIFYIATYLVISLGINEVGVGNKVFNIFNTESKVYGVFYVYLIAHSIMFYGAIFFNKKHFIKTVFSLFLIGVSLTFLNKLVLSMMIVPKVYTMPPFTYLRFMEEQKYYSIEIEPSEIFTYTLIALIVGLLWISAFYRLKEKEV